MNPRLPYLREKTSKLTVSPGVYLMKNKDGAIIYIGKAKNLKNRVTSYFRENPDHLPKVAAMVSNVYDYDFIVTDSEYEALLLECSLIKQHKPKYNILLKDDKGYHYIRVSDDEFPRITSEKNTKEPGEYLGPYTSGFITKETVNEVNRVFMLPTCHRVFPRDFGKGRPCLNFHIKMCMGLCRGKISSESYRETISKAVEYIKSGSMDSVERMEKEMLEAAENCEFERAAVLRDRIAAVKKASEKQKIIGSGVRSADVIGIAEFYDGIYISVLMYRENRLWDKAVFEFGKPEGEDILSLFITQFYHGKTDIPKAVIVDHLPEDSALLEEFLNSQANGRVKLWQPQRGRLFELLRLAKNNSAEYAALKNNRTGKEVIALEELGQLLGLEKPPKYIEAYDISNLSSESMVAGMVVFEDGRPLKKAYKRFNIKEQAFQNDYGSMQEVLRRRLMRIGSDEDEYFSRTPDLILLDGGKGHVNVVQPLIRELGLNIPVFGMVKDSKHRTRAVATGGREIQINNLKSAFMLVTRIQDEVHRYSVSFMHSKHKKKTYKSELTNVRGIGEKKAAKLMLRFKTKENLRNASPEELAKAAGVSLETARQLWEVIRDM
ncbi:MAG: excinuclease ABC subunit UvrC [Ruminococcus sp.]|nr:excinuclease ABC subunit UvrC [Ruminococcus sp.]